MLQSWFLERPLPVYFPQKEMGAMVNVSVQMAEEFTCLEWKRSSVGVWMIPPTRFYKSPQATKGESSLGITTFICPHHGNCFPQTNYNLCVYQHCGAKEAWGSPSTGLFGCPRGVSPVKAWPVFLPHRFLSSLRVCAKENSELKWLLICIFIWFFLLKIICIWKLSRSLWI